jgi:predicted O-methyltransferase YrrM
MNNFKFTETWFSEDGLRTLTFDPNQTELHFLEIGSFEGMSTIWFLENYLNLSSNSTITCVDPWSNYSQDGNSLNTYGEDNSEWNFADIGVKERFLNNILESGFSNKVRIHQDLSDNILPNLISQNKKFDMIFIDGNHVAPYVLMDSVMSWKLLKIGGYMVFDDYTWESERSKTLKPGPSIDYFIEIFSDYLEETYDGYRKIIKKTK